MSLARPFRRWSPLRARLVAALVVVLFLSTCSLAPVGPAGSGVGEGTLVSSDVTAPTLAAPELVGSLPDEAAGISVLQGPADPVLGAVQPVVPPALGGEAAEGPPAVEGAVTVVRPRIRLTGAPAPLVDAAAAAGAVEGVALATSLTVGEVQLVGAEGPQPTTLAAVEANGFRQLTPQVTADSLAVWQRLAEGELALTHDAARRLGVELGQRVPMGSTTMRVGALASNGAPPVADGIVTAAVGSALALTGEHVVLVGLADGADAASVAGRLEQATGMGAEVLAAPTSRQAFLTGSDSRRQFEPFNYVDNGDGMIQPDAGWVQRNIRRASLPVLGGEVLCHRLMIPQLRGALQEIADAGLAGLIDTSQYGGCWVPRHIDFNPARPISMHAWGLAVDINVSTNQLGAQPTMDPRIVDIFDRWGFAWGGRWGRPDGMHFELAAVLK